MWSSNLWWACPALTPHLPSLYHSCLKATCKDNREVRKLRTRRASCSRSSRKTLRRRKDGGRISGNFVRLQLEAPLQTSFAAVFEKLLPIRERLALPGATARTRITGGDATLDRIGAVVIGQPRSSTPRQWDPGKCGTWMPIMTLQLRYRSPALSGAGTWPSSSSVVHFLSRPTR